MFVRDSFFLLTAPPAWGKTRLFRQWVEDYKLPFLYVSPLRALANEVIAALGAHAGLMQLSEGNSRDIWQRWSQSSEQACILVVTPEQLGDFSWPALAQLAPNAVIVWDEIHLIPLWGYAFRDRLLEQWWGYCESGLSGVGLTATADHEFQNFLQDSLSGQQWEIIHGDAGNFTFKTTPLQIFLPLSWLNTLLCEVLQQQKDNTLVFCAHRDEVDQWVELCRQQGVQAIGCKGGETATFSEKLMTAKGPVAIFSTSCLSHGVNLPKLGRVVLLYQESCPAMVHQMMTRGGRQGEDYQVWQLGTIKQLLTGPILKWGWRVMVAQLWLFVGEWWHGAGRTCNPDYSSKRARPSCSAAFT